MLPEITEIKAMRVRLGMTQSALARASGVSQSIIAKVESGRCDMAYSTAQKLFSYFSEAMASQGVRAENLMGKDVVAVKPSEKVSHAISLMRKHSFSALPVIDGGRAVGHISDDTLMRHISEGKQVSSLQCAALMDEPFPRVDAKTPAMAVGELLKYSKAVLVTRGEKVVGIITKADMLKLIRA